MAKQTEVERLANLIGCRAHWIVTSRSRPHDEPMLVVCRVTDARHHFGRDEVKIAPIEGHGSKWVSTDTVEIL